LPPRGTTRKSAIRETGEKQLAGWRGELRGGEKGDNSYHGSGCLEIRGLKRERVRAGGGGERGIKIGESMRLFNYQLIRPSREVFTERWRKGSIYGGGEMRKFFWFGSRVDVERAGGASERKKVAEGTEPSRGRRKGEFGDEKSCNKKRIGVLTRGAKRREKGGSKGSRSGIGRRAGRKGSNGKGPVKDSLWDQDGGQIGKGKKKS